MTYNVSSLRSFSFHSKRLGASSARLIENVTTVCMPPIPLSLRFGAFRKNDFGLVVNEWKNFQIYTLVASGYPLYPKTRVSPSHRLTFTPKCQRGCVSLFKSRAHINQFVAKATKGRLLLKRVSDFTVSFCYRSGDANGDDTCMPLSATGK